MTLCSDALFPFFSVSWVDVCVCVSVGAHRTSSTVGAVTMRTIIDDTPSLFLFLIFPLFCDTVPPLEQQHAP